MNLLTVFFIFFIIFLIYNAVYFVFPSLSPVPFFPSNRKDIPMIVDVLLKESSQKTIIDLGAGTGTVIFALADQLYKKHGQTTLVAVEIHPLLYFFMQLKRLLHPYKKHIHLLRDDMFSTSFWQLTLKKYRNITVYLYIGTKHMNKLKTHLSALPVSARIVSYMYAFDNWQKHLSEKKQGKIHNLYIYSPHAPKP